MFINSSVKRALGNSLSKKMAAKQDWESLLRFTRFGKGLGKSLLSTGKGQLEHNYMWMVQKKKKSSLDTKTEKGLWKQPLLTNAPSLSR